MDTKTLTIIATETCARCKMLAGRLTREGIPFTYALPDTHPDDHATSKALGYNEAPVTLVRDAEGTVLDHWASLNRDKLATWAPALRAA